MQHVSELDSLLKTTSRRNLLTSWQDMNKTGQSLTTHELPNNDFPKRSKPENEDNKPF